MLRIIDLLKEENTRKSIFLYVSILASMGLAFVTTAISTRYLGADGYGEFKFIVTAWLMLDLLISFGLYHSGSRVIVVEHNVKTLRELAWTILVFALSLGLTQGLLFIILSGPLGAYTTANVSLLLRVLAPFAVVYPLRTALMLVLQSNNKIYSLGSLYLLPALFYFLCLVVMARLEAVSVLGALVAQQATLLIVLIGIIIFFLRPQVCNPLKHFSLIWKENGTYGWPVYVGAIFAVATGYLNRMMIPLWVDMRALGFYSIALQFVEPLKLIPGAIATTSFREFSSASEISGGTFKRAILFSMAGFLALFIFIGFAIDLLLGPEFSEVIVLARLAASGAILHGYGDLYNRFLGAHGKGQTIRNMTYFVGFVNVVSFLFLTPFFHIWGAVVSTILGSATYGLVMWFYYLKSTQFLRLAESV